MGTVRVGVREFRERTASFLESDTPVAITRHGETRGVYVPTPRKQPKTADVAELKGVRDLQVEATPPCVPPSSLQTRHSDGSSGEPGSRWLLERSRTFLTF